MTVPSYNEIGMLIDKGNYLSAIEKLNIYLSINPKDVTARLSLAKCYNAIGDIRSANTQYEILGLSSATPAMKTPAAQLFTPTSKKDELSFFKSALPPNLDEIIKSKMTPRVPTIRFAETESSSQQHLDKAYFYLSSMLYNQAIDSFRRAVNSGADCLFDLAYCYDQIQDYNSAILTYTDNLMRHPSHFASLFNRSIDLVNIQQYDEALKGFQGCLALDPKAGDVYHNIGHIYSMKQNYKEAASYFKYSISINPKYARSHSYLGKCYEATKNYQAAAERYEYAFKLEENEQNLLDLINVTAKIDPRKAIELCSSYHEVPSVMLFQTKLYLNHNLIDPARALIMDYSRLNHRTLAKEFMEVCMTHEFYDLAEHFVKLLLNEDRSLKMLLTAGAVYRKKGKYNEAIMAYKSALGQNPQCMEAISSLAYVYGKTGNNREAIKLLKLAYEIDPKNSTNLYNYLTLLIKERLMNEAALVYDTIPLDMKTPEICSLALKLNKFTNR